MNNQPRKGSELFKFPDATGLSALEVMEQNEEFYEENIREVEAQYGGTFVRDKQLAHRLLQTMQIEASMRGGVVSRQLHLVDFPAEEFVAVPIVFEVKMPIGDPLQSKRWYFIRRPRLFAVGSAH
ncbi:MAG: hypothetical protein ABIH23_04825 [bacterium]